MFFLNQESDLTWNSKYQILYFYALWMPFNQKFIDLLNNLKNNVAVFAINTDYFKGFCKRFNITTIPTIVVMESGREIKRIQGVTHSSEYVAIFDDICSSEAIIHGEKL